MVHRGDQFVMYSRGNRKSRDCSLRERNVVSNQSRVVCLIVNRLVWTCLEWVAYLSSIYNRCCSPSRRLRSRCW